MVSSAERNTIAEMLIAVKKLVGHISLEYHPETDVDVFARVSSNYTTIEYE